jgi:hypothetical protein
MENQNISNEISQKNFPEYIFLSVSSRLPPAPMIVIPKYVNFASLSKAFIMSFFFVPQLKTNIYFLSQSLQTVGV